MIQTCQRLMLRRMMKRKRKVVKQGEGQPDILEPWLDWQIRSMTDAKDAINAEGACARQALTRERQRFVDHIGRFGYKYRQDVHLCKAMLLWRPLSWWKKQQWFNDVDWEPLFHKERIGMIRAYDRSLSLKWLQEACLYQERDVQTSAVQI